MPLLANPMPTVDQILAQQRRPGFAPVPAPARQAPAKANLGVLAMLNRALSGPINAPPPPPPPAVVQPAAQAAPPAQPAGERADPRTAAIHRENVIRIAELLGGGLTPEQVRRVNQVSASTLLQAGREASPEELEDAAADLAGEFGWAAARAGMSS